MVTNFRRADSYPLHEHARKRRKWFVFLTVGLTASLALCGSATAQDPDYVYSLGTASGPAGSMIDVPMFLDNTGQEVQGWSMGICHDPAALTYDIADMGADGAVVNGGAAPAFFSEIGSPTGVAIGVVIDFFGVNNLAPGADYELHIITYVVVAEMATNVDFCDTQGNPAVVNSVVVSGGQVSPVQVGTVINDTATEEFPRGDCNFDGSQNIADGIYLLGNLFPNDNDGDGIPDPNPLDCMDACDGNDDGQINIGDAITVLGSLFGSPTTPLPAPYPGCGEDPTADMLDCPVSVCP